MPPWNAEPGYGHFADERRLTEAQIEMIREWARSEEPEGDPREKSAPPRFASGWRAGYFALAGPVTFSGRGGRVFRHGWMLALTRAPSGLSSTRQWPIWVYSRLSIDWAGLPPTSRPVPINFQMSLAEPSIVAFNSLRESVDVAALHHEHHLLSRTDVFERITCDGHHRRAYQLPTRRDRAWPTSRLRWWFPRGATLQVSTRQSSPALKIPSRSRRRAHSAHLFRGRFSLPWLATIKKFP